MMDWRYETDPSLGKSLKESLSLFPREKDMLFSSIRFLWNFLIRLWLKIYFRLEIHGKERLPKHQTFVLIANHSSHLDAIALSAALPWRSISATFSAAAKDYFFSTFFRSFFSAIFLNAIPFERKKNPRKSLELCADALAVSGHGLILFPEGTRSFDGSIQSFKPGLGFLVAGSERLVVPASISGAHEAWGKGKRCPLPKKVTIRIGDPLSFADTPRTKEGFASIAAIAEQKVRNLFPEGDSCI